MIRPGPGWLLARSGLQLLTGEMARIRDPDGFAMLRQACDAGQVSPLTRDLSLRRIAAIMAAKGGLVSGLRRRLPGTRCRGAVDRGQDPQPGCTSTSCCGQPGCSRPRRGQRPDVHHPRPAHPGRADRPVRHRARAGPRPAGGLPHRTPDRGGLLDPAGDRPHPGQTVLARPGTPQSRHQLAPPVPGGNSRLETAEYAQDAARRRRRAETPRTAAANALFTVRAFYLDIARGPSTTRPGGASGRHPARSGPRRSTCERTVPAQGEDGPAEP